MKKFSIEIELECDAVNKQALLNYFNENGYNVKIQVYEIKSYVKDIIRIYDEIE